VHACVVEVDRDEARRQPHAERHGAREPQERRQREIDANQRLREASCVVSNLAPHVDRLRSDSMMLEVLRSRRVLVLAVRDKAMPRRFEDVGRAESNGSPRHRSEEPHALTIRMCRGSVAPM
jgi:putative heme degradation protein